MDNYLILLKIYNKIHIMIDNYEFENFNLITDQHNQFNENKEFSIDHQIKEIEIIDITKDFSINKSKHRNY